MKKLFLAFALVACFAVSALCQGSPPWTIQEIDGNPRVNSPTLIKVTNGTLSCTGKTCTITISGGGGGSPGGSSTQVQYNAAGSFGGISGFTSDGTNVTAGSGNLRATRPRFITSIDDTNGNEVFVITATGSAVNEVTIANAATGNNPTFTASGGDANVGINFVPKGSGTIQVSGAAIVTVSATQTLTNKTLSTSNTVSAALTWTAGVKQTFAPDATTAGINVGSVAGDPSGPSNGDLWYDSTANELTARINGANVALGSGGGSGANPTASVGLSAVNGVATTFMRSDAAPPLDQAIAPTWTGAHIWSLSNAAAVAIGPNGNTNPAFRVVTNVASATSGISITGRADGTAPTLQTLARPTQTASIAGNGLEVRADDAVAGSSTAGAAAGGDLNLRAGAAARLTSGNANGGNVNITPGAGIGTGVRGQAVITDNGALLSDTMLRFSSSPSNQGWTYYFGWAYMHSGASVAGFINNEIRLSSTTPFGWTNSSVGSTIDAGFNRLGVGAVRVITSSYNPGNLLLGTSSGAFGTSAAGVLAFSGSTAPSTSTTDTVQVYSGDAAATDHNLYARNEAGQINRLTGLAVRNSAQFDVTSSTALATITGLTENVEAGRTYAFRAYVQTSAGAGGIKLAVGGTATATAISYEGELTSASDDNVVLIDRATALGTTVCDSSTTTTGTCKIEGVIQVNAAGTLVIQFAQSASNGTASSVLANQYLQLIPIS